MGLVDRLVAAIAGQHQIPQQAAHGAIALVTRAHAGDRQALATLRGASPNMRGIAATALRALSREPAWWTAHYVARAHSNPLPPSHPYARHIAAALARTPHGAPPAQVAGRHGGGGWHGGGHHDGGGGLRHVEHVREEQAQAFGGPDWGGPWGYGSEYLLLDRAQMDGTPPSGDGDPEWREGATQGAR